MPGRARTFTFHRGVLDSEHSSIICSYTVEMFDGSVQRYSDSLYFLNIPAERWQEIPNMLIDAICEDLSMALGSLYWRIDCAREIRLDGFSLSPGQAMFWNEVYEKGLAEYFYLSHIDFHGLISFPMDTSIVRAQSHVSLRDHALVALGGGKDSIVTAETLKSFGVPFETMIVGNFGAAANISRLLERPAIEVHRRFSPALLSLSRSGAIPSPAPLTMSLMFISICVALLQKDRYVLFSNEKSSDIPNLAYRGLSVNHQWTKSTESERLFQRYIAQYCTKDIILFSPIRQHTELRMVKEFVKYPRYFPIFSSCNHVHFQQSRSTDRAHTSETLWCGKCPKCVFVFVCLAAFLPKGTVMDIFGKNLLNEMSNLETVRELLGLKGHKPFECVGTPDEMKYALLLIQKRGAFVEDIIMRWFTQQISISPQELERLEREVLSAYGAETIPESFRRTFLCEPGFLPK